MKHPVVHLIAVTLSLVACLVTAQDNRQCLGNSNGTVSFDIQGIPGPDGPRGEGGPKGSTGGVGVRGSQGKTGKRGLKGDIGSIGNKGMTGQTGAKGQKGLHGIQGPLGPTGVPGLPGPQGIQGKLGERGLKGDIGPIGIEGMTGQTGIKGQKGKCGIQGPLGPTGEPGLPGPQGIQGHPGDTILNEEEFNRTRGEIAQAINESIINAVTEQLRHSILSEMNEKIEAMNQTLKEIVESEESIHCGITSHKWTRIAYLDTTQGQTCPPALRTFINHATNQWACGTQHTRSDGDYSVSFKFSTTNAYSHVCGRVRGYVYRWGSGYNSRNIDSSYVDGVSITMGSPRQHLWTYAAGLHEQANSCPCAKPDYDYPRTLAFIGNNYYCEEAFVSSIQSRIAWEDPLWDGHKCVTSGNKCCERFGWFHREVPPTQDYIEVRWMKYWSSEWTEVMTDQLEIWVF